MPNSRLKAAAERLLIVGDTLSDPQDIAVARKYVRELETLALREVTAPSDVLQAAPEELRARVLGSTLKKAYPTAPATRFRNLLEALD